MEEKELEDLSSAFSQDMNSDYIYYDENSESLVVAFDKIFNKPLLSVYDKFSLSAKRSFRVSAGRIAETYNQIFLNEDRTGINEKLYVVLLAILKNQNILMTNKNLSFEDFTKMIDNIANVGDSALINRIYEFVEANYNLSLDDVTKNMKEKNRSVNDQLIISDDHAKKILAAAYLGRLLTPIISQYLVLNKNKFINKNSSNNDNCTETITYDDANQKLFEQSFDLATGKHSTELKNKIYKLVFSRLRMASFSDKFFFSKAQLYGITIDTAASEIYSKIISNSIPKILINLSPVSYLTTISKLQVNFLMSVRFKTQFLTIDKSKENSALFQIDDDDSMTELEKIDSVQGREDEGHHIIQQISIEDTLDNIENNMDVSVTDKEIADSLPYIRANSVQEQIISLMTDKYFKNITSIKMLTANQYAKVLLCCTKFLKNRKFTYLPKILMSKCIKQRDRLYITGSKVKDKLTESKRYTELLNTKYPAFKEQASRSIETLTATIFSSEFVDNSGEDVIDSAAKIGNIAEEIVDVCYFF